MRLLNDVACSNDEASPMMRLRQLYHFEEHHFASAIIISQIIILPKGQSSF
jgi:hypothetical protein